MTGPLAMLLLLGLSSLPSAFDDLRGSSGRGAGCAVAHPSPWAWMSWSQALLHLRILIHWLSSLLD